MSGIVAVWSRDGAPLDRPPFDRVMATIAHRGIDGRNEWTAPGGDVALGHLHFWTTPEEVGETQPLVSGPVALMLDGRIDNRAALALALDVSSKEAAVLSDAALVLRAFERWGEAFPQRLMGSFAVVVWDGARRRLLCARDPLGRRSLFFGEAERRMVVASEPGAVLGGDTARARLDETFLAHYYAVRRAPGGHTLFESVRELRPGHVMEVTKDRTREAQYWSLNVGPVRYSALSDYGERFLELLTLAVARRMRSPSTPGVMMSGGLDSTSVAALAALGLTPDAHLNVYSYVFDELTDLDEREWMQPMVDMYALDQKQVTADDAWPLNDFDRWQWDPSGPITDAFRALNERLFAAARLAGTTVLLTGAASDALVLSGYASWLSDLVKDGRYLEATVETMRHMRHLGAATVLRSESVRRLAETLVRRASDPSRPPPSWLTRRAADLIASTPQDAGRVGGAPRRSEDVLGLFDALETSDGMHSRLADHRSGVEVRDPFADLDVVAFAASVPAYTLYHHGIAKALLRAAMGPRLPQQLLARRHRSDISALYWRGMLERTPQGATLLLNDPDAIWRNYVRADAVQVGHDRRRPLGAPALVPWRCITFEWWHSRAAGGPFRSLMEDNP